MPVRQSHHRAGADGMLLSESRALRHAPGPAGGTGRDPALSNTALTAKPRPRPAGRTPRSCPRQPSPPVDWPRCTAASAATGLLRPLLQRIEDRTLFGTDRQGLLSLLDGIV